MNRAQSVAFACVVFLSVATVDTVTLEKRGARRRRRRKKEKKKT